MHFVYDQTIAICPVKWNINGLSGSHVDVLLLLQLVIQHSPITTYIICYVNSTINFMFCASTRLGRVQCMGPYLYLSSMFLGVGNLQPTYMQRYPMQVEMSFMLASCTISYVLTLHVWVS